MIWPMEFLQPPGIGPLLECDHYALARERLRQSDEKWCETCMAWRREAE